MPPAVSRIWNTASTVRAAPLVTERTLCHLATTVRTDKKHDPKVNVPQPVTALKVTVPN
jgi:hypothetical protein